MKETLDIEFNHMLIMDNTEHYKSKLCENLEHIDTHIDTHVKYKTLLEFLLTDYVIFNRIRNEEELANLYYI